MSTFSFNKIYVIESLNPSEDLLTGKELYEDLLKWKEFQHGGKLKTELIQVNSRQTFFDALNHILVECNTLYVKPIIHLEIHGSTNGLHISSGEFISWNDLFDNLSQINFVVGNNLFLTLAVCFGAYIMSQIKLTKPAPYYGFIGSFHELQVGDLMIRYNEFYKEFLETFNFHDAIQKLFNANPSVPADYQFISSEDTFKKIYSNYLRDNCSKEGIEKRVEGMINDGTITVRSRQNKRQFTRDFTKELNRTKEQFKKDHMNIFFMTKDYPENYSRFKLQEI